jgi:hypothetical protein
MVLEYGNAMEYGSDYGVETVEVILNNCDTRQKTIEGEQQP